MSRHPGGSPQTFDQLARVFIRGLFDKAQAVGGHDLTKYQRSRLTEAMTTDIRKLSDIVFPAVRTPYVSVAAEQLAKSMKVDLRQLTWHAQKKVDNYQSFTYEHLYTIRGIRSALAKTADCDAALNVLDEMLWIAWITKEEDLELRRLGFGSNRPDPFQAYAAAGIQLVETEAPTGVPSPGSCSRCGQLRATWLITGSESSGAPGRILIYCERCRADEPANVAVAVPLDLVTQDASTVLTTLYETRLTESDPRYVSRLLGVPLGMWAAVALRQARADRLIWKPEDITVIGPDGRQTWPPAESTASE